MKRSSFFLLIVSQLVAILAVSCARCSGQESKKITLGDERFEEYVPGLEGKRVAVFSNHSGIVGDEIKGSKLADALKASGGCFLAGEEFDKIAGIPFLEPSEPGGKIEYGPHLVDVLLGKGVDVSLIISPEHGFRGTADAGERVTSGKDEKTGVEIYSMFGGGSRSPGQEAMDKFDVLLVDIQDVGLRYYTYYVTMYHLIDACAKFGKKVIVLDRPDPNGFYVDGPVLDMELRSGVGWLPITTVHGMTLGELALMINGEGWLDEGRKCDLEVVPCLGYSHSDKYSLIVPPSPNLKDMRSVYLYASTCYFEGTVVSLGRGTDHPFEMYGHPEMEGHSYSFIPRSVPGAKSPMYQDRTCYGTDLRQKPLDEIWKERINLEYVVEAYNALDMGGAFFGKNNFFNLLAGRKYLKEMIMGGSDADSISARWKEDVESFSIKRHQYLIYPE